MVKNLLPSTENVSLIPGWGRSPGEGNSNSLQYSCQGNPTGRGAWQAIVHGVAKRVGHDLATKQQRGKPKNACYVTAFETQVQIPAQPLAVQYLRWSLSRGPPFGDLHPMGMIVLALTGWEEVSPAPSQAPLLHIEY